jgi:opacity protein-like surface antigen
MNIASKYCIAGLSLAFALPSFACSICRCGDPTFNALGKEGVAQTGLRVAFDWDQVRKTQGAADDRDSLRERRYSLLAAYGLSDRLSVMARVPYSERDLTEVEGGESEHSSASGLADPEIFAQWRLWASPFEGDVGMRASVYLVGGVKTSWGDNDVARGGERLDEHVQPGTGSNDWFAGLSGSYQLNPRSALFVSTQYRYTGRNDAGYQYGRTTLVNVAYERKLASRWDAVLEANYRHAGRDEIGNTRVLDEDTGGSIVYLTPRLLFDLGSGWVARASAQIPLSQANLNGVQDEKTVFNVGITRLFAR